MVCPHCKHPECQVLDSREAVDSVRRRRECLSCKTRFTTYERIEPPLILVSKKNGDKERFDPEKIYRGVKISCKNRPVTSSQIDALVSAVTHEIQFAGKEEIPSEEIGHLVERHLHMLDPIAYLRFTSVYRSFANIEQFDREIQNVLTESYQP